MEIYTFDKSLQGRLVEFTEILSSRGDVVPASQIKSEWSYHIELVIEPIGWQALWKIPCSVCEEFQIRYPTIVLVEVERIDVADLSALVKITAVQDEIRLPEKYDVPLIELYPTLSQENAALDMEGTASCIDQLRFFYSNLWMPWDVDDDDVTDWVSVHLETRIRLFFDMKRGTVPKETSDIITSLIREGKEVRQKILRIEDSISDEDELDIVLADQAKACQLMKLHFRMQRIKSEMEVLENPAMRDVLVRNQNSSSEKKLENFKSTVKVMEGYIVWLGGTLEQMKETINKAQVFSPPELCFKVLGSLQETLHTCYTGDIVALGEGNHQVTSIGNLEEGGTIRGIHNFEQTIISIKDTETAPCLFDFSGTELLLENVTLDVGEPRAAIIIRSGTTKIINCKICALNQSMVKLGVVVLPGAKLTVEKTSFMGLGSALVIYGTGEVLMNDCSFKNCAEGIQLYDNAKLSVENCLLGYFKKYAIRIETQKYLEPSESSYGSYELLTNISEISLKECKFEGNGKGDVLKTGTTVAVMMKQDGAGMNTDP